MLGNKRKVRKIQNNIEEGFTELAELLIHSSDIMELKNYIPDIISQNNSSEEVKKENLAVLSLQSIVEYVDEKDTRFITLRNVHEITSGFNW